MLRQVKGDVFEVSLKIDTSNVGDVEILKGLLLGVGIDPNGIVECESWPYTILLIYLKSKEKARSLRSKLKSFHLDHVSVHLKCLHKSDWQTKWKNGFKPFNLTRSFRVVPMRLKGKHRFKNREPLYIDTDLAFGTGLHATTRFMAQFVERCAGRYKSFLDVGTGTGILAMIASKCGAQDIMAVDISKDAVNVAKSNFTANDCASITVKALDGRKINGRKKYDFVCANLITQDLIAMARKIITLVEPGQYLAVSGISLNSYETFRQSYSAYPLKCIKIEKGEGWVAVLFKKLKK